MSNALAQRTLRTLQTGRLTSSIRYSLRPRPPPARFAGTCAPAVTRTVQVLHTGGRRSFVTLGMAATNCVPAIGYEDGTPQCVAAFVTAPEGNDVGAGLPVLYLSRCCPLFVSQEGLISYPLLCRQRSPSRRLSSRRSWQHASKSSLRTSLFICACLRHHDHFFPSPTSTTVCPASQNHSCSVRRWDGKLNIDNEKVLMIKTRAELAGTPQPRSCLQKSAHPSSPPQATPQRLTPALPAGPAHQRAS